MSISEEDSQLGLEKQLALDVERSHEKSHEPEIVVHEPELTANASLVQILFPILMTAAIFWWIFSGIDFGSLKSAVEGVSLVNLSLAIGGFCVWMYLCDVLSFGAGFKQLVEPKAPWRDIVLLRGGTIFSTVIFPPLGEVFAPYYFYRKWQHSVLQTVGASFFVMLVDSSCGLISLSVAFLFFDTSMLSQWWILLIVGHALLLLVFIVAFSRWVLPKLPEFFRVREFFYALRTVSFSFTMKVLLFRILSFLGVGITLYYLLVAMGINLVVAHALLFIPFFMASVFLPISTGGYGGPQGAAVLFLVQLWEVCTTEEALAFSLIWSTGFMIGRAVVGGVAVFPLWRLLRNL